MEDKIVAVDGEHLIKLIRKEIELNGYSCDLNHIDVSRVTSLSRLFEQSEFNGDISQWDVSNVTNMYKMFYDCSFNGDISKWDVSKVENMDFLFAKSDFKGDISDWTPYKLDIIHPIKLFGTLQAPVPYWANFKAPETRDRAIKAYLFKKKLDAELNTNNPIINKTNKI